MKIVAVFIIFMTATQKCMQQTKRTDADASLSVQERIALLKYQISQNIKRNSFADQKIQPIEQADVGTSFEYIDPDDAPITPINDDDERKKQGKYQLKRLKTTTERLWERPSSLRQRTTRSHHARENASRAKEKLVADDISSSSSENKKTQLKGIDRILDPPKKSKSLRLKASKKPDDVFYRRIFTADLKARCAKESIHCQDLITPFLTGQKLNMTDVKEIRYTDHRVMRLVQLLNINTEHKTKEDIYSVLYQISNIQIRLFQWDVTAIKLLLKTITKEHVKRHTFRSLKNGLKRLLNSWHMDFTNVTNLLQQARLIRPPCIMNDLYEGSTKSSHAVRYTKPKPKKKCSQYSDENIGSCEA